MEFYEHHAPPKVGFIPLIDGAFILLLFFGLVFNFSRWQPVSMTPESSNEIATPTSIDPKPRPKPEAEVPAKVRAKSPTTTESLGNAAAKPAEVTQEEYVALLTERFRQSLFYPEIAKSRNWQGEVFISIKVGKNGKLRLVRVDKTSGHALLDQAAVDTVRISAPLPAPPAGYTDFVVPLVFRML
ncbi:MAG: TonB family protein [Granulosicoccaceae bacterium]